MEPKFIYMQNGWTITLFEGDFRGRIYLRSNTTGKTVTATFYQDVHNNKARIELEGDKTLFTTQADSPGKLCICYTPSKVYIQNNKESYEDLGYAVTR